MYYYKVVDPTTEGVIHIVCKHIGGGEGSSQMRKIAYKGVGGEGDSMLRAYAKKFFLTTKSQNFSFFVQKSYYIAIYYCV